MSALGILADAVHTSIDGKVLEIVLAVGGTVITGASSVAAFSIKSLIKKVDQLTKALIQSQDATVSVMQKTQREQSEALREVQSSHLAALQKSQKEHVELLQAAHSRYVETMDGTVRENTHALTAISAQLNMQANELHRMEQTILKCPGPGKQTKQPIREHHD